MKKLAALSAVMVTLFPIGPAIAAPPEGPASSVSVYAGGAFMRQYYDDCGYYSDYCGGYYDRSDTYSGPEFGVDARIVTPSGFLFDLSAEHARVSNHGDAFLEQQFTAGLVYACFVPVRQRQRGGPGAGQA
jgi:hypothetical protein